MKRYYNKTTGKWYNEGRTMTHSTENMLFSGIPTEEQLSEWGFEEWVEPGLPEEELLENAKKEKINALLEYDSSENVDSFTIGEQVIWLTVEERQQIATQISANESIGRDTMTRWFNGQTYTFPINTWKQMLVALEVYAGDALNVTESHKAAINALETIQEVEEYDFTLNYPPKLVF